MKAEMTLTILEDGTIKIETGNLQGEHHVSADELIKKITELAGGGRVTTRAKGQHGHHHHHHHQHGEQKQ